MLEKNSQSSVVIFFFFFNDTATTEIYTLSLHDALPICAAIGDDSCLYPGVTVYPGCLIGARAIVHSGAVIGDRKSTRLNSSHLVISYAVFCLKKKKHSFTCLHLLRLLCLQPRTSRFRSH